MVNHTVVASNHMLISLIHCVVFGILVMVGFFLYFFLVFLNRPLESSLKKAAFWWLKKGSRGMYECSMKPTSWTKYFHVYHQNYGIKYRAKDS